MCRRPEGQCRLYGRGTPGPPWTEFLRDRSGCPSPEGNRLVCVVAAGLRGSSLRGTLTICGVSERDNDPRLEAGILAVCGRQGFRAPLSGPGFTRCGFAQVR